MWLLTPLKPAAPICRGTTSSIDRAVVLHLSVASMAAKTKTYERVKEAHANGGYAFTDPAQIAEQRGIVMDIVKQLASNVTQAKNLISVSLPVRLFEPRSYLERLTDSWCYAPIFLKKAAETKDPVERLRLVVTFAISGLQNTCNQKKPFNPILGETFEATFTDGTQICCEQTAHHPPITAWQVFGPNDLYKFYGYGEWTASFSVNSITGAQKGIHIIEFKDGSVIKYTLPEIVVRGIMWGDRIMEYVGTIAFRDITNNLCAKISIPPPSEGGFLSSWWSGTTVPPTDYLRGELYKFTVDENGQEVKGEVLNQINGSWLGALDFDDKQYWSIKQALPPAAAQPLANPLPSDSRFREDLTSLKKGNMQEAHENKVKLEEKQRRARKLRAAAATAKGLPVTDH